MDSNGGADSSPTSRSDARVALDVLPLHSTNLLTVLDEDGVVRYESPAIQRVFGYEQDELVGEPVTEYFHPDDREAVAAAFRSVVASEEPTVEAIEYRHEQADGTYRWVESVASSNPTPAGNYVVNTRDISSGKEREERLRRANERLEEFASVVSHDLRNPLNVAQGRLQLAREDCDSDHLAGVADAHERMESLIEGLLELSQAGEGIAETAVVDLASITERCWRTVQTDGATLTVETDRRLRADPSRLRQLLENLIRNAIEHAGNGVTVTVGEVEAGFFVEDDGSGIPTSERPHVFESGHSTTEDGAGLGLSIVEEIVDAHDWRIRVTDGSRGGARFEITNVELVR